MTDLLTTTQVQDLFQVDRTTIYRMVESGRLPAIRVGKQWRFSRTEIERWLSMAAQASRPGSPPAQPTVAGAVAGQPLRELLPGTCSQLIQGAFADVLGVMMVITDMQGQPVTEISNPCGFYVALTRDRDALDHCVHTWQELAASPSMEPSFWVSEVGLLCARGLIRVGRELRGMVVVGGIAPETWPPGPELVASLAQTFGLAPADVEAHVDAVFRLDRPAQEKVLRSVQRIADIFSHIAEDRHALCGRLQAIASLTTF